MAVRLFTKCGQQHPAPRGKECQMSGEAIAMIASMTDLLEKLNNRMDDMEMKDKQKSFSMQSFQY